MIKTGVETGVLGLNEVGTQKGIYIFKNIYNKYSDLDAKNFIYTAGITGNVSKEAIFYLCRESKMAGIYDRLTALYPMVGGDALSHSYNLTNPGLFQLLFVGGWRHSTNGSTPNGSNAYANTGINASTRLTQNNNHISVYSRTNIGYNGFSIGAGISNNAVAMYLRGVTNAFTAYNATTAVPQTQSVQSTNSDSRGFYITNKTSAAIGGLVAYKNGANIIGANTSVITLNSYPNTNLLIAALTTTTFFDIKECAFASVGLGLTVAQIIQYNEIVQNFQALLNRNV